MSQAVLDQLEQSKQRAERANARRTRIQVQLESARQQYAEAVSEAEAAHKTADLDKLREKLVELEAENAKAVAEFVRAVDDYEAFIVRIEEALANPEAMTALLATVAPANKFDAIMASAAPMMAMLQAASVPGALPGPVPVAAAAVFNEDDI